jgi:hypothetical protein
VTKDETDVPITIETFSAQEVQELKSRMEGLEQENLQLQHEIHGTEAVHVEKSHSDSGLENSNSKDSEDGKPPTPSLLYEKI